MQSTPVLAVPQTGISTDIAQLIAETVKQAVAAAMAKRKPRTNYTQNQTSNQQNRPPPTCYTCQAVGHISKFCPKNNQPPAPQENPSLKNTQSLVADTSEMDGNLTLNV